MCLWDCLQAPPAPQISSRLDCLSFCSRVTHTLLFSRQCPKTAPTSSPSLPSLSSSLLTPPSAWPRFSPSLAALARGLSSLFFPRVSPSAYQLPWSAPTRGWQTGHGCLSRFVLVHRKRQASPCASTRAAQSGKKAAEAPIMASRRRHWRNMAGAS
ncbi:hypothetical protein CI102_13546 [Trichoderma harzianum]|uniref:Uncharacterized protein n=1 Tax=Trichoderma harzianum CBS 226.95 TaxID=983964 RepID=A0A2T4ATH9_TRIHA|nr:hypothetical protein M431DRAFT_179222 [Trichoderma harzianum CBS 226.95]PKK41701.1 hypothetical protein CI102_13546 [Trichoderma harzianum]PTB60377.1 hypothetical protein M431DRAFT_179222 [Trichoderma harzianum CBS 226.95]